MLRLQGIVRPALLIATCVGVKDTVCKISRISQGRKRRVQRAGGDIAGVLGFFR